MTIFQMQLIADNSMLSPAYWFFIIASGLAILTFGVMAVVKEIREEGFNRQTWVLRAFFLAVTAGVGYALPTFAPNLGLDKYESMLTSLVIFMLVFSMEIYFGAINISALVFGAMIGIVVAHLAYFLLLLVLEPLMMTERDKQLLPQISLTVKMLLSVVFAYLFVLLFHKNRDRFNFVIPYVEFRRERRGGAGVLVDTSAVIDGRLADLCDTNIIEGPLVVPKFVLRELQTLADSADKLKRARGRRGIDMLNRLRKNPNVMIQIDEGRVPGVQDVDAKLIKLAETLGAKIVTTDVNLNKVANVQGISVININDLATVLKPSVLPGEQLMIELVRAGEAAGQAVGYMDDGTMVVAESSLNYIGKTVPVVVTRMLQTPTGRIIFTRLKDESAQQPTRARQ